MTKNEIKTFARYFKSKTYDGKHNDFSVQELYEELIEFIEVECEEELSE